MKECRYCNYNALFRCMHPNNIRMIPHPEHFGYVYDESIQKKKEINKNNDCEWFEKVNFKEQFICRCGMLGCICILLFNIPMLILYGIGITSGNILWQFLSLLPISVVVFIFMFFLLYYLYKDKKIKYFATVSVIIISVILCSTFLFMDTKMYNYKVIEKIRYERRVSEWNSNIVGIIYTFKIDEFRKNKYMKTLERTVKETIYNQYDVGDIIKRKYLGRNIIFCEQVNMNRID